MLHRFCFSCFAIVMGLFLASCQDDDGENPEPSENYQSAQDNARAESESNIVYDAVDQAFKENRSGKTSDYFPDCAEAYIDTTDSVNFTIVVDFGDTTNCLCSEWDGRYRRGKIKASYTGFYRDSSTVISYATENYHVNDFPVNVTKTVENMGTNAEGNLHYNIDSDVRISTQEGDITWNAARVREWVEGESTTLNIFDDVYTLYDRQAASGTNRFGNPFDVEITEPLRAELGCRWFLTDGAFVLRQPGKDDWTIDYGDGGCDSEYTLSVRNVTVTLNMR